MKSNENKDCLNIKLLPESMKSCCICKRKEIDFKNLNEIRKINQMHSTILSSSLGRKCLNERQHFKYKNDESLRPKTSYIDNETKEEELWTVCNCAIRAHPDCLLESFNTHFKFKCDKCNNYYRIGYITKFSMTDFTFMIIKIILSIIFFIVGIVFLTRSKYNLEYESFQNIRIFKSLGLLFLCSFIITIQFIIYNILNKNTNNETIQAYLLPFAYKYDPSYGINKFQLKNIFNLGKPQNHNKLFSEFKYKEVIQETRAENDNIIASTTRLNCPFYNELIKDINSTEKNKIELIKGYEFDYKIDEISLMLRNFNYLKFFYRFHKLDELLELKLERNSYFNLIISRHNKVKFVFNEMKEEFNLDGVSQFVIDEEYLKTANDDKIQVRFSSNKNIAGYKSKKKSKQKSIKSGTTPLFNQLKISTKQLNTQVSKNHNININRSSLLDSQAIHQYSINNSKITKGKSNNHLPYQNSINHTKTIQSNNKKQYNLKRGQTIVKNNISPQSKIFALNNDNSTPSKLSKIPTYPNQNLKSVKFINLRSSSVIENEKVNKEIEKNTLEIEDKRVNTNNDIKTFSSGEESACEDIEGDNFNILVTENLPIE